MRDVYYYLPISKMPVIGEDVESSDKGKLFGSHWHLKAQRLRARRWKKVRTLERLEQIKSQREHWLSRHGWLRVARPLY